MVAERRIIDLEDIPDGLALAEELAGNPDGILLRRGGETVGRLVPVMSMDTRTSSAGDEAVHDTPSWVTFTVPGEDFDPRDTHSPELDALFSAIPVLTARDVEERRHALRTDEDVERLVARARDLGAALDLEAMRRAVQESREVSIASQQPTDSEDVGKTE